MKLQIIGKISRDKRVTLEGVRKLCQLLYVSACQPLLLAGIVAALDTIRTFPDVGAYKLLIRQYSNFILFYENNIEIF